jgi:hypothetical protein
MCTARAAKLWGRLGGGGLGVALPRNLAPAAQTQSLGVGCFLYPFRGSLRGESSSNSLSGWGVRRGEAATYTPPVHEVRWFVAHCNEQYVRTPPERLLFFCCYAAKKHPTPNCFGGCHLHNPGCKQSLFERYWGDTSQNAGAGVGGGHGRHPSHLQ